MPAVEALPQELPPLALASEVPAAPPDAPIVVAQQSPYQPQQTPAVALPPLPPAVQNLAAPPNNGQPVTGATTDLGQLSQELAAIQRRKIAESERASDAYRSTMKTDQERTRKAYDAAGVGPDALPKWDADAAREKFAYNPVEAFSSLGSLFAITAAAFTRQPMANAMAGSAAAMNAIKEGNTQEYERSYKAWQDNTKLALDRQKIMDKQYQNAVSLLSTNMEAGNAEMKLIAAKYGDKEVLTLLENGLNKPMLDLLEKRNKISSDMQDVSNKAFLDNIKRTDLLSRGYDPKNPATPQSKGALWGWTRDWNAPGRTSIDEKFVDQITQEYDAEKDGPFSEYLQRRVAAYNKDTEKDKNPNMLIGDRMEKQAIQDEMERLVSTGVPRQQALFQATQTIKENLPGKVQDRKEAVTAVNNQIDAALTILKKYEEQGVYELSPSGVGGIIQRGKEFLSGPSAQNLDATQVHQYQKLIQAQIQNALPAHVRGKMNLKDRADFDAMVGATPFTNVQQSIQLLENLKKTVNKQDLSAPAAPAGAVPLPERYKNEPDGTVVPHISGKKFEKRGNKLVPVP